MHTNAFTDQLDKTPRMIAVGLEVAQRIGGIKYSETATDRE
jgi:hypothetical protein